MSRETRRGRAAPWNAGWMLLACVLNAAAAGYDEATGGDLSNDRLAPTRLVLEYGVSGQNGAAGNNVVSGTTGRIAGQADRDYFTAVVPHRHVLSAVRVGNQTTSGGAGGSFIAVAAGPVMSVAENPTSATGLLGWRHYGAADRGQDILPLLGAAGQGASGFAAPLPAGEYTFWIQELATGSFSYRFNLMISPVPEPEQLALLIPGLALTAWRARRALRAPVRSRVA